MAYTDYWRRSRLSFRCGSVPVHRQLTGGPQDIADLTSDVVRRHLTSEQEGVLCGAAADRTAFHSNQVEDSAHPGRRSTRRGDDGGVEGGADPAARTARLIGRRPGAPGYAILLMNTERQFMVTAAG
jgi:hypothetical protein